MKNSGGERERDTQVVLDVGCRDADIGCHCRDRLAGFPAVEHVFDAHRAVHEDRLAERPVRVDDYEPARGCRGRESRSPAVRGLLDAAQVLEKDLREHALPRNHLGQPRELDVAAVLGIVEENLRTVRAETLRSEGMRNPDLLAQDRDRTTDVLHADLGLTECGNHHPFRQAYERYDGVPRTRGQSSHDRVGADLAPSRRPARVALRPRAERGRRHAEKRAASATV